VAAASGDQIVLRGLTITGTGAGYGINALGYRSLSIEACSIRGGLAGILIQGSATSYAVVTDTVVRYMSYGLQAESHAALVRFRTESTSQALTIVDAAS